MNLPLTCNTSDFPTDDDFLAYGLEHQFGELHFKMDPSSGMKALIAIHNTTLGPSLGGTRLWNYATEDEALRDVLRKRGWS